jgi:hypothetical protein
VVATSITISYMISQAMMRSEYDEKGAAMTGD